MGCRSCCYGPRAAILAAAIGTLLCIGFSLTFHFFPSIFHSIVVSLMTLTPGGPTYATWAEANTPDLDITTNVYFFNYTNVDGFMANWREGVKPIVTEMGPYTYTVHLKKVFIDWSEPPYVKYRQLHYYYFHPELSNGDEDDEVVIPNIIALALPALNMSDSTAQVINYIMKKYPGAEPPFRKVKVGEYLVYGYYDEALDDVQIALQTELVPGGMFGLVYGKNATDDQRYKVETGAGDPKNMYGIVGWNDLDSMEYVWGDKYCGMINGTDGTLFAPGLTREDQIHLFISTFRKSFHANYTNDATYKGIKGYEYRFPLEQYADYNMNPDNECHTDRDPDVTYASGALYMGKLAGGAPGYLSNPHFLDGDFKLVEAIDGLHPNNEEHRAHFLIIPELGAPIKVDIRLQFNALIKPYSHMSVTKDWPTIMLPILWGNGSGGISDAMAADIDKYYYGGVRLIYGLILTFLIICGLVGLTGIVCTYTLMFKYKSSAVLNDYQDFHYSADDKRHQVDHDLFDNKKDELEEHLDDLKDKED